jgi:hypothetical protein
MSSQYEPGQASPSGQTATPPGVPQAGGYPPDSTGATSTGATSTGYARSYYPDYGAGRGRSGGGAALGFTMFAAAVLVLGGIWQFLTGLAAVIKGSFFLVTPHYAYNISISSWGWIHIGLGAALFLVGCCLFARQTWARVVGIFIAVISAVMNFLFIPRYPWWSIIMILLDIVIVWALATVRPRRGY